MANHPGAVDIVVDGGAVRGIRAVGRPSGRELDIGARRIVLAAGPRIGSQFASLAHRSAVSGRLPG